MDITGRLSKQRLKLCNEGCYDHNKTLKKIEKTLKKKDLKASWTQVCDHVHRPLVTSSILLQHQVENLPHLNTCCSNDCFVIPYWRKSICHFYIYQQLFLFSITSAATEATLKCINLDLIMYIEMQALFKILSNLT